jgi:hypothetical protein
MTKQEIIELAKQADIYHSFDSEGQWDGLTNEELLERNPEDEKTKQYRIERLVEILAPFAKLVEERTIKQLNTEETI